MTRRTAAVAPFAPIEDNARAAGYQAVVGVDEVGRGPLAGPVVAAAVLLPPGHVVPGLADSKRLTARQRDTVYRHIQQHALSYGIGVVAHTVIDQRHIAHATQDAMLQAVQRLCSPPDLLLIDGIMALPLTLPQRLIIQGDSCCASIAAASVVAKVIRDRLMIAYAQDYPAYGFEHHKGYPSRAHYAALRAHGPCTIHRRSFRGVLPYGAEAGKQGVSC